MVARLAPVTIVETAPTPTAVVAETTTWEEFPDRWPQLLEEVWTFVRTRGLGAGRNVMLYRDDRPNVEVGVELGEQFVPVGRITRSSLPAGRAATTIQRGPPSRDGIAAAHSAVLTWCEANGYEVDGTRWEVYGHWAEDGDPADYEIEVYWLLR